ncbi:MAG: oxidoreductase [Acidobacteria bacterium]|nr:oxidoreductase [Acidobacteriota bacterium]
MNSTLPGGTFPLADDVTVSRMGYGAMQLSGPGIFGPPADEQAAINVLHAVVEAGITHIDTSDFYGPHITNQLIRRALHPYADNLHIVTKVGARRDAQGGWPHALSPAELRQAVQENLSNLGLARLDVVNLRVGSVEAPTSGSIEEPFTALAELQSEGLINHLGVSNVTAEQVSEAQSIAPVVCVQNLYNVANRVDEELLESLAEQGIAFVPFFPLGGFSPLQSATLLNVATRVEATPMAVALAWLLNHKENILLIPGTSSVDHLRQNIASAALQLPADAMAELDSIGG